MDSLSGKIAETPHGQMVDSLGITVLVVEAAEPSQRRWNRQNSSKGFSSPSGSSRKASRRG